jgi:uncharacterized protein YndB with AHSA1/START domain
MTETFVYVTYIASTPEKVWDALTNPEFTRRYWNGRLVESDWRVGSPVTIRHDYDDEIDGLGGTVLDADRPRRLSFGTPPGTVTFELAVMPRPASGRSQGPSPTADDVVRLTVIHAGLDEAGVRAAGGGWSFILSNLKTLLESGAPLPMPESVLAAFR